MQNFKFHARDFARGLARGRTFTMAEPKLDNWYVSNRFTPEQGKVKWIETFLRYDRNPYIKDSNPEVSLG